MDIKMKALFNLVADIGKNAVLDGTVNSNDLRHNKKQMAVKLAKTAAWTLIQRHPFFIAVKYGAIAVVALLVVILLAVAYFAF
jgi:hypothetical protein